MLVMILITTGLTLITPIILRDLIDHAIPTGDVNRLVLLAFGLLLILALGGLINVFQRRLNAYVGEGVIYDLRLALYAHLQRMSLRFFTHTKVGELMSRLNNDVVGAQNAISNTIVGIINIIQAVAVLAVMLALEWRLTLISVAILPLFILTARRLGSAARHLQGPDGGQRPDERHDERDPQHRRGAAGQAVWAQGGGSFTLRPAGGSGARPGVRRAVLGTTFFVIIGLLSAVGTALVYGIGGYLVIRGAFTVGQIVQFGAYLTSLYMALRDWPTPVEFATSVVSFERVFEVIDLPHDIQEQPDARVLRDVRGELVFEDVSFRYLVDNSILLSDVQRFGSMHKVTAVLWQRR